MVRQDPPDPPVPGVPGALRVRVHVLQPVLGTREGRRRGPGRGRAPQAVRAGARRMEPRHVFCQIFVGRFGVSFSPFERLFLGRFGFGQSCGLSVIA